MGCECVCVCVCKRVSVLGVSAWTYDVSIYNYLASVPCNAWDVRNFAEHTCSNNYHTCHTLTCTDSIRIFRLKYGHISDTPVLLFVFDIILVTISRWEIKGMNIYGQNKQPHYCVYMKVFMCGLWVREHLRSKQSSKNEKRRRRMRWIHAQMIHTHAYKYPCMCAHELHMWGKATNWTRVCIKNLGIV